MAKRVVLAYSGGLDTSVAIRWIQEKYDAEVITLTLDMGQPIDLEAVRKKALDIGAKDAVVVDAKEVFVNHYVKRVIKANALYEGKYPLSTSITRPLIARELVKTARMYGADAVAHGCTGKGNDQVRIEVSVRALDPSLEIIAPIREWGFSREEEIEYAEKHGIPVPVTKKSPYSIDENLWGRSIESGILEDLKVEPPEEPFVWTRSPMSAPDEPEYVEIGFERGIPVSLNGKELPLIEIITALNSLAGLHGIGRIDMIEDRLVGIKSREVYEVPAATVIIYAHKELEHLVMERNLLFLKSNLENEYAKLIYDGLWFSHMREALEAFFDVTQEVVNGTIKLKLYKGNIFVSQRSSPFSLYERSLATYEKGDIFDQKKAEGFIYIWGLPLSSSARKRGKKP